MSGAWSQLEQLLTCAICLDRFRNPKLLPCQHTFCGEPCMEGLVDYARRQIKCPECRAEHRIPYNGVQSFPNNVTLARFLDLHRSITGDEPEPLPSQMDRCSVCGEKSYCNRCAHCEKKVCEECGKGHLDILRREINRINTQVRRSLEKLSEHAEQANKGSEKLLQITGQIRDEITESVRRLIKDLKDKETKLLEELDEYTESETKNSSKLKTDFETELDTITSNCELVEKHITDADEWTDQELMEYKDIFLKTLDFLRNLDPDSMDYSRKIKFIQKVDLDALRRSAIEFGEIKIQSSSSNFSSPLSPSESTNNLSLPQSSLMRSQSDHRLAQFGATGSRSQRSDPLQRSYLDVTGQNRYGSDSERGSSPPGRRSGEVRFGSVHERSSRLGGSGSGGRSDSNDFSYTRGWPRPGDSDYEPSNSANFRSRFMRERIRERAGNAGAEDHSFEDHDSDTYPAHRVRFQEESPSRPKLFDTEEMINMRAPLSGLIKLIDSPHFMERLQQNEIKAKQREAEAKENENLMDSLTASTPTRISSPQPVTPTPQRPSRQISEDEIEKQKKQNQAAFSQANSNNQTIPASSVTTPTQPTVTSASNANTNQPQSPTPRSTNKSAPINRRIQSIQKEERGQSPSLPTTPTLSDDNNSESGGPTVNDDDIVTVPNSSNNNTSYSRRRIFASQGKTGSGSTNASVSQSLDYGDSRPSSKSSSAAINNSSLFNHSIESTRSSSSNRYGLEDPSSGYYRSVRLSSRDDENHRFLSGLHRDESLSNIHHSNANNGSNNSSLYGSYIDHRRNAFNRRNTFDLDDNLSSMMSDSDTYVSPLYQHASATRRSSFQNDRLGSSISLFRNRLAKSKSSHAVPFEDSDEEGTGRNNSINPLSPPITSSFKSRFNSAYQNDYNDHSISSSRQTTTTAATPTARSGYVYRTREQSPEEEPAGSLTQYLINKYGTRNNRQNALSKSKSSHVLFGRSLSSSDDDGPINPPAKLRRESINDYSFKTSPIGLAYPRNCYLQKKRVMMKIGSRGTSPSCFTWPRGVACAPDNGIVVADSSNHRVQVFDSTGRFQFEFGSYGNGEGEFDCLAGVTVNRIGHLIVSDRYNHRVQVFDATGRFLRAFGSEGRSDGKFSYPWGIATDALGFIYVCDKENHRIQVFQSDGTFVGKFGSIGSRAGMLEHPHYIAVSNMNRVIVSDSNNHRIQIFDINGRSILSFGSEGSGEGQFKFPRGVAVDDNGFIIVGDSGNNRIQIFNPDGTFIKAFGQWGSSEGEFKGLEGVAISSTGNILVCDRENHRIQIF